MFRDNLIAVIGKDRSVNSWAKEHGLEQTTVQRIVNGTHEPKLSMIERVARALGVEAWQLMVPGFSLTDRPVLQASDRTAADHLAARMEQVIAELQELRGAARATQPKAQAAKRKAASR